MRSTKLGAALASLAITAGTATLLAAGPAQADTPTEVTLTLSGQSSVTAPYRTEIGLLSGQVTDGVNPVTAGSVDLEQKLPGHDWKIVKTDDDLTDGVSFGTYGSRAKGNVKYRAHYLGGTDGVTTWDPARSDVVTVITLWRIRDTSSCPNGHCHISGRLGPSTRHHRVLVQIKRNGGWHRYRVLHTSLKSTYRVGVSGSRRGTRYRIIIAGTRRITATEKRYVVTLVPARNRTASLSPR
jgi:hypothetical protein